MNEEVWVTVRGYKGYYQVSSLGLVRSVDRYVKHSHSSFQFVKGRILKPGLTKDGYETVQLSKLGLISLRQVHRLVAFAFCLKPEGCSVVNHKDGNKRNNTLSNLEWCTHSDNEAHAVKNGLKASGERNGNAKLTESDVREIRRRLKLRDLGMDSIPRIAKYFRITVPAVHQIKNNKTWRNVL